MNHILGRCLPALLLLCAANGLPADELPSYTIHRAGMPITVDARLDEPAWLAAPSVGDFRFAWWKQGKKEQTVAKMLWDDTHLYVAYLCEDAHIAGTHTQRDSSVWLDDAVEVFASPNPDTPDVYYNIEMSVTGAWLDHYHPKGVEGGSDRTWNPDGVKIVTRVYGTLNDDSDTDEYWVLEAAIPFKAYEPTARHTPPQPGDMWRLNLNRLGGKTNEQFSQWSPGTAAEPQFHAPQDFGRVIFSEKRMPF